MITESDISAPCAGMMMSDPDLRRRKFERVDNWRGQNLVFPPQFFISFDDLFLRYYFSSFTSFLSNSWRSTAGFHDWKTDAASFRGIRSFKYLRRYLIRLFF